MMEVTGPILNNGFRCRTISRAGRSLFVCSSGQMRVVMSLSWNGSGWKRGVVQARAATPIRLRVYEGGDEDGCCSRSSES